MVYVYEALIGAGLIGLAWWLWGLTGRAPAAGLLIAALMVAFFWPWIVYADWGLVARIAGVAVIVALGVLGYARLIRAARRAAETTAEHREDR